MERRKVPKARNYEKKREKHVTKTGERGEKGIEGLVQAYNNAVERAKKCDFSVK